MRPLALTATSAGGRNLSLRPAAETAVSTALHGCIVAALFRLVHHPLSDSFQRVVRVLRRVLEVPPRVPDPALGEVRRAVDFIALGSIDFTVCRLTSYSRRVTVDNLEEQKKDIDRAIRTADALRAGAAAAS